jgi:ribose transport system permease protein
MTVEARDDRTGTAVSAEAAARGDAPDESLARRVFSTFPILQILSVIVLLIVTGTTINGFFSKSSLYTTLILASFLGIAAAGQTLVILIGGIDLSVPALITGANLVATLLAGKHWPFGLAIAFVLVCAALVGVVNGFVTHHFRVPPLRSLITTVGSARRQRSICVALTRSAVPSSASSPRRRTASRTAATRSASSRCS